MKKTNTSNPLKFFNDAKAARNKSLVKAQDGRIGPMTQQEAAAEAAATSYSNNIPYANPKPRMSNSRPTMMDPKEALEKANRPSLNIPFVDTPQPTYLDPRTSGVQMKMQKKGGTHKMPNGKVMLNSAMKKKTSKKK
jgi:hypothetical protein